MTARELLEYLNTTDEVTHIEAKRGSSISKSVMETVCAYANEPGIDSGYFRPGPKLNQQELTTNGEGLTVGGKLLTTEPQALTTEGKSLTTELQALTTEGRLDIIASLGKDLQDRLLMLGSRSNAEEIKELVLEICADGPKTLQELALIFQKTENWLSRGYLKPLLDEKLLTYLHESMPNHPDQAYVTNNEE